MDRLSLVGFLLTLFAVMCTSQLVTLEMACEMECIKTKTGHAYVSWDSPEAADCRQECRENPFGKYLQKPDAVGQGT